MSKNFSVARYYDQDTGNTRWAVYCKQSSTWYFAGYNGQAAAKALCDRLNKEIN